MHVFIHCRRVARTVCIFPPLLVSVSLLGVCQKGRWSPRLSPAKTGMVGFFPLFFKFLQGVSQHLGCLIFLDSQMCLIWTLTRWIHFWGSFQWSMSLTSLEGVPKWSGTLWRIFCHYQFPRDLLRFFFFPILLEVSTLVLRFIYSSTLICRFSSVSYLSQNFICFIGAQKFLEGLIHDCKWCPAKSSPCLLLF